MPFVFLINITSGQSSSIVYYNAFLGLILILFVFQLALPSGFRRKYLNAHRRQYSHSLWWSIVNQTEKSKIIGKNCLSTTYTLDFPQNNNENPKLNQLLPGTAVDSDSASLNSIINDDCTTTTPKSSNSTVFTTISPSLLSLPTTTIFEEDDDDNDEESCPNDENTILHNGRNCCLDSIISPPSNRRALMIVLISRGVCFRDQAFNQERALYLLKSKKIQCELIDGMNQEHAERREELFHISGIRGHYPQIFISSQGALTYIGNQETLQQLNDDGKLCPELLNDRTDNDILNKVIDNAGNDTSFFSI